MERLRGGERPENTPDCSNLSKRCDSSTLRAEFLLPSSLLFTKPLNTQSSAPSLRNLKFFCPDILCYALKQPARACCRRLEVYAMSGYGTEAVEGDKGDAAGFQVSEGKRSSPFKAAFASAVMRLALVPVH